MKKLSIIHEFLQLCIGSFHVDFNCREDSIAIQFVYFSDIVANRVLNIIYRQSISICRSFVDGNDYEINYLIDENITMHFPGDMFADVKYQTVAGSQVDQEDTWIIYRSNISIIQLTT